MSHPTRLEEVLAALRLVPKRHRDLQTGFLCLRNARWDSGVDWPGEGVLEGTFLSASNSQSTFVAECDSYAGELRYRVEVVGHRNVRTRRGRIRRTTFGYDVVAEGG